MKFQIIIIILLVIMLFIIINSVRKHKLEFRHALSWIVCDLLLLILGIFPGIISCMAGAFGVEVPINMLFFFGIVLSYCLIYGLSVAISTMQEKIKKLTQEVALLEEKIEELCK